jgi:chemotaxis protein CheD
MRVRSTSVPAPATSSGAPDTGDRAQVYLHAGQLVVATEPTAFTTILGSCVAVCLYDPIAKIGGMNHFLLPYHVDREHSPRFGSVAVPQLLDAVRRAGASQGRLVAKLFGGASVIAAMGRSRRLGDENFQLAMQLLEEAHVPVLDRDVGGTRGRKVVFLSDEGTAWVRQL